MSERCAYCGVEPAIHREHVIPRSIVRRQKYLQQPEIPAHLLVTVRSCGPCNWHKGQRLLVPPSWEHLIPELKAAVHGAWRCWDGDTSAPAFTGTFK